MAYVYLSPKLHGNPSIRRAALMSPDSVWLWVEVLCWRSRHRGASGEPDDYISQAALKHILGRKRKPRKALIEAGLLVPDCDHDGKPGYRIAHQGKLWRLSPLTPRRAPIPELLRQRIYERDEYACVECGATEDLTLDHIFPWSLGGPDTLSNLQTMCRPCNSRKGARV